MNHNRCDSSMCVDNVKLKGNIFGVLIDRELMSRNIFAGS